MIESLLTIAGSVGIGIWMYKRGYKNGYHQAVKDCDGFYVIAGKSVKK